MNTTRKECRHGHRCQPANLKEALDCVAHHSERTVEQLADATGLSAGTLGKQLSRWDEGNYPTIRQVVPLTLLSGNDALLHYFSREAGGFFVRLPQAAAAAGDETGRATARMLREFGELIEAMASASEDGRITDREIAHVEAEWADVVRACLVGIAQLRRQNGAA